MSISWCVPAAFIGEFDALEGHKVTYAFECYGLRKECSRSPITQMMTFVSDEALLSRHIASGKLHPFYAEYMQSVVARVLISNEPGEESVIFQDSQCPTVGGFSFSLSDILARGENRRLCVVIIHPSYHQLVSRWELLSRYLRVLIDSWQGVTNARHAAEYATFADLERLREEARRKPLRSLMELLSLKGEAEVDVFTRVHCFFEHVLPRAFSIAPHNGTTARMELQNSLDDIAEMLHAEFKMHGDSVVSVNLDSPHSFVPRWSSDVLLSNSEIVIKPLAVWLVESASGPDPEALYGVQVMLEALFSGHQIVVSGDDALDCANLVFALSYVLPRSLRKTRVKADEYVMPYDSQLVSFSDAFSARYVVVYQRADHIHESDGRVPFVLGEIMADHVVHVEIRCGCIVAIAECDSLRRISFGSAATSPRGFRFLAGAEDCRAKWSTMTLRIARLVRQCAEQPHGGLTVATCRVLQSQLEQLVAEYVLRGRVYTSLFHQQEIAANRDALGLGPAERKESFSSKIGKGIFSLLGSSFGKSGQVSAEGSPSAHRLLSSSPHAGLEKHTCLEQRSVHQFKKGDFFFTHASSGDHMLLLFLGSATPPL